MHRFAFQECEKTGLVKVASKKDLMPASMMGVEVNGKEICLVNLGNTYYAIGNRCTHMGCMLSDGELGGENVRCSCHGSMFNIKTGNVIKGPAKNPEPTYQVKTEADQIMIDT
jgi:nitrite reductase/ring-hydroxylating ferredoxin subunit